MYRRDPTFRTELRSIESGRRLRTIHLTIAYLQQYNSECLQNSNRRSAFLECLHFSQHSSPWQRLGYIRSRSYLHVCQRAPANTIFYSQKSQQFSACAGQPGMSTYHDNLSKIPIGRLCRVPNSLSAMSKLITSNFSYDFLVFFYTDPLVYFSSG